MSNDQYVVVGGSRGVGFGIVERLVSAGHDVTVLSRTPGQTELIDRVRHVSLDLSTDEVTPAQLPDQIEGLVYCPGTLNLQSFRSLSPDTFRSDFELNVVGAVKTLKAGLKALKSASTPSVVLFSTVAVGQGMMAHSSIAASKGAVEGLTRSLAAELSPRVRVNCIAPALTETSLTQRLFSYAREKQGFGRAIRAQTHRYD